MAAPRPAPQASGAAAPPPAAARLRPADLALVGAVALGLRLAMAWSIPLAGGLPDANCAPDEAAHFQFVAELARGRAPTWPATSVYGAFVPAPYLLHAAALAAGRAAGLPDPVRFPARQAWAEGYGLARLGSVLWGVAAALATAACASALGRAPALLAGLAAAAWPQAIFASAYVNADAYGVFAVTALAAALARWAVRGEGAEGLGAVGVAAGAVVVGKLSAWYALPPTAAWAAWAVWRGRAPRGAALRSLGLAAAVAVPLLAWNAWRNGGDVLGVAHYRRFLAEAWGGHDGRSEPGALDTFLRLAFESAFATFGNMHLRLPEPFPALALTLLAVGLPAAALALRRAPAVARRGAAWLAAASLANLALLVYNCWFVDFSPQGRYLLPSALLLAGAAVAVPAAARRPAPRALGLGWALLGVGFLLVAGVRAERVVHLNPCVPAAARGR